jgi:Secretion system C-terminal sorting domain/Pregnancy-associated plasma protein-A
MKQLFLIVTTLLFWHQHTLAQRKCAMPETRAAIIANDPSWEDRFETQRQSLQPTADRYKNRNQTGTARKTTTASAIPVIFHIVVTNAQFDQIGGYTGIAQRIDSQIAVLNRDFNRENPDSVFIPSGWKHLYASVGIRFGLAHTNPAGYGTPGYEIKIIPETPGGFSDIYASYHSAKHDSTGGMDSWDVTKYLNIWCINFAFPAGLLGATTAKSATGGTGFPLYEEGICINYAALGKRASTLDYYIPTGYAGNYYDMGRSLTHEMGHFFEIKHTWGDDGGNCPWSGSHKDDGLADTPPEADYKYYNYPDTIPGGTYYDACRYDGAIDTQQTLLGVATHDFMNYTDDIGMFMFTTDQAAVMISQVSVVDTVTGENISLVQHPELLEWSPITGIAEVGLGNKVHVFPTPSSGIVYITTDQPEEMQQLTVVNILGQTVQGIRLTAIHDNYYTIDLSTISKGIYFVRCNFAAGSITRKILLQ